MTLTASTPAQADPLPLGTFRMMVLGKCVGEANASNIVVVGHAQRPSQEGHCQVVVS